MRPRDLKKYKGEEVLVVGGDDLPPLDIGHLVGRHCRLVDRTEDGLAKVLFKGRMYQVPPSRLEVTADGA